MESSISNNNLVNKSIKEILKKLGCNSIQNFATKILNNQYRLYDLIRDDEDMLIIYYLIDYYTTHIQEDPKNEFLKKIYDYIYVIKRIIGKINGGIFNRSPMLQTLDKFFSKKINNELYLYKIYFTLNVFQYRLSHKFNRSSSYNEYYRRNVLEYVNRIAYFLFDVMKNIIKKSYIESNEKSNGKLKDKEKEYIIYILNCFHSTSSSYSYRHIVISKILFQIMYKYTLSEFPSNSNMHHVILSNVLNNILFFLTIDNLSEGEKKYIINNNTILNDKKNIYLLKYMAELIKSPIYQKISDLYPIIYEILLILDKYNNLSSLRPNVKIIKTELIRLKKLYK